MTRVFLFGTLLDDDLRAFVARADTKGQPAAFPDHAIRRAAGADFPALVRLAGDRADGMLFDFDETAIARLDYYEAGFGFEPCRVQVTSEGQPMDAFVYRPMSDVAASEDPWSLTDWQRDWAPVTREAARESMAYFGRIDGPALRGRVPTIFVRAASRVRAAAHPMPAELRADTHRNGIRVLEDRRPYANFFRVDETDLRHPTFGGGLSDTVTRAGFVMGDAVTVLPYDPARDRVMVVEQFRFGPFARGDLHPWCLEPIAGRIDPGEDPDTAARRESAEEAHLALGDLLPVASHYPSPGAISEYIYSFIGLADLPDATPRLGGEADENEDIRAHVIPFDRLLELIRTGEADTAPLLLSALWLERERATGRFA